MFHIDTINLETYHPTKLVFSPNNVLQLALVKVLEGSISQTLIFCAHTATIHPSFPNYFPLQACPSCLQSTHAFIFSKFSFLVCKYLIHLQLYPVYNHHRSMG